MKTWYIFGLRYFLTYTDGGDERMFSVAKKINVSKKVAIESCNKLRQLIIDNDKRSKRWSFCQTWFLKLYLWVRYSGLFIVSHIALRHYLWEVHHEGYNRYDNSWCGVRCCLLFYLEWSLLGVCKMTANQAAEILGCAPSTVKRMRENGERVFDPINHVCDPDLIYAILERQQIARTSKPLKAYAGE